MHVRNTLMGLNNFQKSEPNMPSSTTEQNTEGSAPPAATAAAPPAATAAAPPAATPSQYPPPHISQAQLIEVWIMDNG